MWTGWGWGQRGGGELRQSKKCKKCTFKKIKNLGNNQSNPIKYIAWVPMSHPLGTIVAYDKNVGYICRGYACLGYPCRAFDLESHAKDRRCGLSSNEDIRRFVGKLVEK